MSASTQWQLARDAAERYEKVLVPAILGPAARALVDWSNLQSGETVIDVGCGTGAAARFAAEHVGSCGRVIAIDVNAGMLEVARSLPPVEGAAIEWQESSVYELPLSERTVDVALCAQTLQFLDNRRLALSSIYRVLKPGGRVALSLWHDIEESPYFHRLVGAILRHIGQETAAGLKAAFGLSNARQIHILLEEAGFERIEMNVEQLDLDLPRVEQFVPQHIGATPMAAGFNAASQSVQQAVIHDVKEGLRVYETGTGIHVPFRSHLVTATR